MIQHNGRTALITGASSGIGKAYAELLAEEGYSLVITARRKSRLADLAKQLKSEHGTNVTVIAADLADPITPAKLVADLQTQNIHIDMLVNNAGFGGDKPFLKTDWSQLQGELQLMVVAVTQLMHLLTPAMVEQGWGRVLNVASVAGYAPIMKGLLYSGTKSYLVNVSQAVDMELRNKGVFVTALCPGLTETEFFEVQGSVQSASQVPQFAKQSAEDVARIGYDAMMAGKPVIVPGVVNKALVTMSRHMPEALRYQLGKRLRFK